MLQQDYSKGLRKLAQGLTCDELSVLDERIFKILLIYGSNLKNQPLSAFDRFAERAAVIIQSFKEGLAVVSEISDSLAVTLIKFASTVTSDKLTNDFVEYLKAKLGSGSRSTFSEAALMLYNQGVLNRRIESDFDFRQPLIASTILASKMDSRSLEYYQLAKYLLNVEKENFSNWLPMTRYLIDSGKYDLAAQWLFN